MTLPAILKGRLVIPAIGAPMFLAMTADVPPELRATLANRIAINAFILLLASLFIGTYVLEFFGLSDRAATHFDRVRAAHGLERFAAFAAFLADLARCTDYRLLSNVQMQGEDDDTDGVTMQNTPPVYEFLADLGLRTTRSVWPIASARPHAASRGP